jgi:hypothetical protein
VCSSGRPNKCSTVFVLDQGTRCRKRHDFAASSLRFIRHLYLSLSVGRHGRRISLMGRLDDSEVGRGRSLTVRATCGRGGPAALSALAFSTTAGRSRAEPMRPKERTFPSCWD